MADFANKWNNNQVTITVSRKTDNDAEDAEKVVVNQELSSFFSEWQAGREDRPKRYNPAFPDRASVP